MIFLSPFFQVYFHLNLILLCSLLFFLGIRFLAARLRYQTPPLLLLRYAQTLILISVLAPPLLHALPEQTLTQMNFRVFREFAEVRRLKQRFHPVVASEAASLTTDGSRRTTAWAVSIEDLLFALTLLGFLTVSTRTLFSFRTLSRTLAESVVLKHLHGVHIAVSENTSIPFSYGFLQNKWVVLPVSILNQKKDRALAIKHELQHHRQNDPLWALGLELLTCIFFANPAIYGWKQVITELQEFSCDEALIGQKGVSPRDYGSCLVRVAETALVNRELHAGTVCMATISKNPRVFKSLLHRRIKMMLQDQKSSRRLAGFILGTLTVLSTLAVAYGTEQSARTKINSGTASVDEAVQKIADDVLSAAIKNEGADSGIAIVADPNTGVVLAISNIDTKASRKGHWALSEQNEPASFMKAVTTAEAIENESTTPVSEHNCENGAYQYGDETFHDWKTGGWKKLTTTEAVAISSDICAMKIAETVGPKKLHQMLESFGFGEGGTASAFPEASAGRIPAPDLSKFSKLVPATAYGMGFTSTPLEILQAFGAIANGGKLLAPQMANALKNHPEVIRRVLSEDSAQKMRTILQQVVLTGTARNAPSKLYTMAGKTETSFTGGVIEGDSTGGSNQSNIAGFVGFAPALHPRVEVYVQIFHPADVTGAHGSTHAVPVFTALIDQVLKHMDVAPDKASL